MGYSLLQAFGSVFTESVQVLDSAVELSLDGGAGVDDDCSGECTVFAGVFTGYGFGGVGLWSGGFSGVSTIGCDAGAMCARHDGARSLLCGMVLGVVAAGAWGVT